MNKLLLGIDVGTTGTKTYLLTEDGAEISHAYIGYETFTPDTGTCEQDANKIWEAVVETVRIASASVMDKERIVGISLSTQGGTLIPTDSAFRPLCRAIVWSDKRCGLEREAYLSECGDAIGLYEKTGWKLSYGLPILQIRRLHDRMPELFQKVAYFLSVPDFLSAKMTGIPAVDFSNAGINQLTDIRACKYDSELCAFARVDTERLPRLTESCTVIGHLTPAAAAELGLCEQTVVVAGAHDQYAVALGASILNDGDMLIGSGTSWVVTAIRNMPDFSSGLSQSIPANKGKWGAMLYLSYGGVCLEWLRKNIMLSDGGSALSLYEIDRRCESARAAADGLMFYPFSGKLSDKETESNTRAAFIGLDISHDRFDMALAVMEGVAFQIKWMCECFKNGNVQHGIKLSGGAAKSAFWSQIIADVFNCPVIVPAVTDMACVGAAVMAGVGAGVYPDAETGSKRMMQEQKTLLPNPVKAKLYAEAYRKYRKNAEKIENLCI